MGVHGADVLQDRGAVGQGRGGTGADFTSADGDTGATGALVLLVAGAFDGGGQQVDEGVHALVAFGADIDLGAGGLSDGIDPTAAFNQADVDRRLGAGIEAGLGEEGDGPAQGVDGVADAVVAPTM